MLFVTIRVDLSWFESGFAGVISLDSTSKQYLCAENVQFFW